MSYWVEILYEEAWVVSKKQTKTDKIPNIQSLQKLGLRKTELHLLEGIVCHKMKIQPSSAHPHADIKSDSFSVHKTFLELQRKKSFSAFSRATRVDKELF